MTKHAVPNQLAPPRPAFVLRVRWRLAAAAAVLLTSALGVIGGPARAQDDLPKRPTDLLRTMAEPVRGLILRDGIGEVGVVDLRALAATVAVNTVLSGIAPFTDFPRVNDAPWDQTLLNAYILSAARFEAIVGIPLKAFQGTLTVEVPELGGSVRV